jgi:hypothetical protein
VQGRPEGAVAGATLQRYNTNKGYSAARGQAPTRLRAALLLFISIIARGRCNVAALKYE